MEGKLMELQREDVILFTNINNGKGIRIMPDKNKGLPEWITTTEAAEIMGIHIESVRRHCRKDDSPIKCKQFGMTWMIWRDDAIAYAENKENFVGGRGKEGKL